MTTEAIVAPILLSIFIIAGLYFFYYSTYTAVQTLGASKWPVTNGEIKRVKIDDSADDDGYYYETTINYTYTVNGLIYHSNRTAYGLISWSVFWFSSRVFMESTKNYPLVSVRYSPENPAESTLAVGVHRFHVANFIFSSIWLVFCIFMAKSVLLKHYHEYSNLLVFISN